MYGSRAQAGASLGTPRAGTQREQDGGAFDAQRVRGTGERRPIDRRPPRQFIDHVKGIDLALERRPSGCRLEVFGALAMKETDDAIAPKVRRVRHRRPPVAVGANQHVLFDERRVLRDEGADRVEVIAPDRVRKPHGVDEPCPARSTIASCEGELRVRQRGGGRVVRFGMVLAQQGDRIRIAGLDGAEQFLGLTLKLLEIGADGQATHGHDEPPSMSPWSAGVGQGGSR